VGTLQQQQQRTTTTTINTPLIALTCLMRSDLILSELARAYIAAREDKPSGEEEEKNIYNKRRVPMNKSRSGMKKKPTYNTV